MSILTIQLKFLKYIDVPYNLINENAVKAILTPFDCLHGRTNNLQWKNWFFCSIMSLKLLFFVFGIGDLGFRSWKRRRIVYGLSRARIRLKEESPGEGSPAAVKNRPHSEISTFLIQNNNTTVWFIENRIISYIYKLNLPKLSSHHKEKEEKETNPSKIMFSWLLSKLF